MIRGPSPALSTKKAWTCRKKFADSFREIITNQRTEIKKTKQRVRAWLYSQRYLLYSLSEITVVCVATATKKETFALLFHVS